MAENNPFAPPKPEAETDDGPADDVDQSEDQSGNDQPDQSQDELARTRAALKKANSEAAKFRKQLDAVADKDKTEQQRIAERAEAAEKRAEAAERQLLRVRVATRKQLAADLADRLQGDTEEDLEADADALLKLFSGAGTTQASRRDPDQGRRDTSTPDDSTDMNRWMRSSVRQR